MINTHDILNFSFSTSHIPTPIEFALKVAFMLIIWISFLSAITFICQEFANILWSHPVPIGLAFIPSKVPHPNPPGGAIPFGIPLMKASDEQIDCFMKFRDKDWLEKELLKCRNDGDRGRAMQRVANSAALYKGILYEERFRKWGDDHFRLKIPHKYPHVGRHWNGWSSFWIETSPGIRIMFTATVAIIVEHVVNGFILPMFYLFTLNPVYYNLALYGEVAFMMYATILLAASYVLGRDYSLEQMDKAVWHLLLLHHIASLMLCVACILVCGETTPKDLVCYVLLALLGLTSSLHYVGIIMDLGPLSLVDSPRIRMGHHIICMLSQICFRGPFWLKVVYLIYLFIIDVHGAGVILVAVMSAFLLLTAFNADFIKYHIKATMGNIREISVLKKK